MVGLCLTLSRVQSAFGLTISVQSASWIMCETAPPHPAKRVHPKSESFGRPRPGRPAFSCLWGKGVIVPRLAVSADAPNRAKVRGPESQGQGLCHRRSASPSPGSPRSGSLGVEMDAGRKAARFDVDRNRTPADDGKTFRRSPSRLDCLERRTGTCGHPNAQECANSWGGKATCFGVEQ